MSGSNGIPRYAETNREDELIPLRYRGVVFSSIVPISLASTATLTADQVMSDLIITGAGGGIITWPSSASVIANLSANGLLQNYFNGTNTVWTTTLVNNTAGTETLVFPPNFQVSTAFPLTIGAMSTRVVHYLIQGTNVFVY